MRNQKRVIHGRSGDHELENYLAKSEKMRMVVTLSKMEGYQNIDVMKLLRKQLKGMSHSYHRFADSKAGQESLSDELLEKLMTQKKVEKAEQVKMKEKTTEKHHPEVKKQKRKEKEENGDTSMSSQQLRSRLAAAETELKELRSRVERLQ